MKRTLSAAALLLPLAACQQVPIDAQLRPACGPLDGAAFEIAVPVADGTLRLTGEGAPGQAEGRYSLADEERAGAISIDFCPAGSAACELAERGYFHLARGAGGGVGGRLDAQFPRAGEYSESFATGPADMRDPPVCG